MDEEIENKLKSILSDCINEVIKDIKGTTNYNRISQNKKHKITIIPEKTERLETDEDGNCIQIFDTHSIFIPQDQYYKALAFTLENAWVEKKEGRLDKIFKNFNLSPIAYIYHDLIEKNKINCAFEIKVEFNLKKIQYENNNEIIDFSYDIDEDTYDTYEEDENSLENDKELEENIDKFKSFCEYIVERIEQCGQFTILTLTNWNSNIFTKNIDESGHRNVILVENTDKEIYFHHYEPHGSETDYLYEEREEFFEKLEIFILKSILKKNMKFIKYNSEKDSLILKMNKIEKRLDKLKNFSEENIDNNSKKQKLLKSELEKIDKLQHELKELKPKLKELDLKLEELKKHKKLKKVTIEAFNSSYCEGLQTRLQHFDRYGFCSLFSYFWLYSILKCFFCMNRKYKNVLPMHTWVRNFEELLINKFEDKKAELYDLVIAFGYRLFSKYFADNTIITKEDKLNSVFLQNKAQETLFDSYETAINNGEIKLIVDKDRIKNEVDKKRCEKNVIVSDFIIEEGEDEESEDEQIEENEEENEGPSIPGTPEIEYEEELSDDNSTEKNLKILRELYPEEFN